MRPTRPTGKGSAGRPHPPAQGQGGGPQSAKRVGPTVYWQAVEDAYIFAGPLGEVVGTVETGTVVREIRRYQDDFGGWWIGTRQHVGPSPSGETSEARKKGEVAESDEPRRTASPAPSLLWISFNNSQVVPMQSLAAAPAAWVQVFVEEGEKTCAATPGPASRASSSRPPHLRPHTRKESASSTSSGGSARSSPSVAPTMARSRGERRQSTRSPTLQELKPIPAVGVEDALQRLQSAVSPEELMNFATGAIPGLPSELDLITHYWEHLHTTGVPAPDSWHQRYLCAVEDVMFHESGVDIDSMRRAQYKLQTLTEDFSNTCQQLAVAVVERMLRAAPPVSPLEAAAPRTPDTAAPMLTPHPSCPTTVFYADGLLLRLCCDTPDGFFGGERRAQKYVQKVLHATTLLSQLGPRHLLHVPLCALVDFEGYRLLVSSIPPISKHAGCVFASFPQRREEAREGTTTPAMVDRLLSRLAATLQLKEHPIASGKARGAVATAFPVEMEVYAGRDRRLYLSRYERIVSLVSPCGLTCMEGSTSCPVNTVADLSLSAFRPEILLTSPHPCNVNIGVAGCSDADDVTDMCARADAVKLSGITSCAGMIGMHLPLPQCLRLPTVSCTRCQATIDGDELRFVVCRSPERCCRICCTCYTAAAASRKERGESSTHSTDAHGGSQLTVFKDAVKCWRSTEGARALRDVVLEPGIADLVHANGVSMRHLGYVYHRLPTLARPFVGHFVEGEMVARAAVHLLRPALRGAAAAEDARRTIEGLLAVLLQTSGAKAERLWAKELGPAVEKAFPGIVEPFFTGELSRERLLERIGERAGIAFTPASLASLRGSKTGGQLALAGQEEERPFLQVRAVNPRVRTAVGVPPPLSDAAAAEGRGRADVRELHKLLEPALLFWVGYTPEGSHDAVQPRYLEKLMSAAENGSGVV